MTYLATIFSGITQQFAQKFPNGYKNLCTLTEKISLLGKNLFKTDSPISREKVLPFLSLHKGKLAALVGLLAAGCILYRRPSSSPKPEKEPEKEPEKPKVDPKKDPMPALEDLDKPNGSTTESPASSSKTEGSESVTPPVTPKKSEAKNLTKRITAHSNKISEQKKEIKALDTQLAKLKTEKAAYDELLEEAQKDLTNKSKKYTSTKITALRTEAENKLKTEQSSQEKEKLTARINLCTQHLQGNLTFKQKIAEITQRQANLSKELAKLEENWPEGSLTDKLAYFEQEKDIAKSELDKFERMQAHYNDGVKVLVSVQTMMLEKGRKGAIYLGAIDNTNNEAAVASDRLQNNKGDFKGEIKAATEKYDALTQKCDALKQELESLSS